MDWWTDGQTNGGMEESDFIGRCPTNVECFQGVNRIFVLTFDINVNRLKHSRFYVPTIKIGDYSVIIDGKKLFWLTIKNDIKTYENMRKITTGQGDDYTTGCFLDCYYFNKHKMMMMIMMMMNCFCGMVDQWKAFHLNSSRHHCQRSSPSWISNMPRARFVQHCFMTSTWCQQQALDVDPKAMLQINFTGNLGAANN